MFSAVCLLMLLLAVPLATATGNRFLHRNAGRSTVIATKRQQILNSTRDKGFIPSSIERQATSLKRRLNYSSNKRKPVRAISRTGVCVPEDVGLYGRTVISYECLYSKDGKTQTGDEWEYEQIQEANKKYSTKVKKPKKEKVHKPGDKDPPEPLKRVIIPPPFNTTGMFLREGDPYLVLSTWLPGVEKNGILVLMDYAPVGDAFTPSRYETEKLSSLELSDTSHKYYESIESVPRGFEQHQNSYNSTYNDLFNHMVETNEEMGHYSAYSKAKDRPPLFVINAPKNTIVKQFEFNTFGRKRDPNHPNRYNKSGLKVEPISDRIQRAYRPFSYVDLRDVKCNMRDGTLQIRVKLTRVPPPPDMRKIFKLEIGDDEVPPPRLFPEEQVHGWMYNWHHFHKYDLNFDLSKLQPPEETPEERDLMEMPDPDPMTRREAFRLVREYDEWHKKN